MKHDVIVNIYNFIRMSHVEPSIFIPDDFETVRNQIILIRQYGFPATYALKYDALMDPRYQELLKTYTGRHDEISAWWEITEELCKKAGVVFRGARTEDYDERVNSAYSIGYAPEERRKLVDAYMDDFYSVFGFYPKTIGSWVLDTITVSYAALKYGIVGSAICRDQMGTDGFTLWGGYPNGIYYPSWGNENIPANTSDGQLSVPMFRLLGPDPIYNFEQDVRDGLQGVYTLEPSWLIGRNPEWISWFFGCLTKENSLGTGYAHVGQENNFLWENIQPGLEPQLKQLRLLKEQKQGSADLRIETMAESAVRFRRSHRLTPPMTFQASEDWNKSENLSAQWYACCNYRIGFLGEQGHLRIRDFFLYRQEYPSRYLHMPMDNAKSTFDALPVLFPQLWIDRFGQRPFLRLLDRNSNEPVGSIHYLAIDRTTSRAELHESGTEGLLAAFTLYPDRILLEGNFRLCFDFLPVFRSCSNNQILMEHEGFTYSIKVTEGTICRAGQDGLVIAPEYADHPEHSDHPDCEQSSSSVKAGRILLTLGTPLSPEDIFTEPVFMDSEEAQALDETNIIDITEMKTRESGENPKNTEDPVRLSKDEAKTSSERGGSENPSIDIPPMAPVAEPGSCIFSAGFSGTVTLTDPSLQYNNTEISNQSTGQIRYTLDGTDPGPDSCLYIRPLTLRKDTTLSAKLFLPNGRSSETAVWDYRFGIQGIRLTSGTVLDPRPVFSGKGIEDLLEPLRGSLDYLDGRWRGTLQDFDIWGELPEPAFAEAIIIGFLSHHRSGIIFPETLKLFTGMQREDLALTAQLTLPCEPCAREIARQDFPLPVHKTIKSFRLIAHRYDKMPQWCCYRGSENVFTMADNIIVIPGSEDRN